LAAESTARCRTVGGRFRARACGLCFAALASLHRGEGAVGLRVLKRSRRGVSAKPASAALAVLLALTLAGSTEAEREETVAPPAEEDLLQRAVPVAEIAGRAKTTIERVRELEQDLNDDPLEARLEKGLVRLAKVVEPRVAEIDVMLASAPSVATLESLRGYWRSAENEISGGERRLRDWVGELELQIQELK
jgi:hypothetical protein